MFRIGRSVEALFRKPPELPSIEGDAFVFGSAPNPVVPEKLLSRATVVTANASQLYLERFGFEKPDIIFMRSTMHWGESTDHLKQEQLRGRSTGLLVLPSKKTDPNCTGQLEMLDRIGYRFDDLKIVFRHAEAAHAMVDLRIAQGVGHGDLLQGIPEGIGPAVGAGLISGAAVGRAVSTPA